MSTQKSDSKRSSENSPDMVWDQWSFVVRLGSAECRTSIAIFPSTTPLLNDKRSGASKACPDAAVHNSAALAVLLLVLSCSELKMQGPHLEAGRREAQLCSNAFRRAGRKNREHKDLDLSFKLWLLYILRKNLVQLTSFRRLDWTINMSQGELKTKPGQHKSHRALFFTVNCKPTWNFFTSPSVNFFSAPLPRNFNAAHSGLLQNLMKSFGLFHWTSDSHVSAAKVINETCGIRARHTKSQVTSVSSC